MGRRFEVCHSENLLSRWQPLELLRLNAKAMSLSRTSQRIKKDFRCFRHFRYFRDANKRYAKILAIRGDYIEYFRYFRHFRYFRELNKIFSTYHAYLHGSFKIPKKDEKTKKDENLVLTTHSINGMMPYGLEVLRFATLRTCFQDGNLKIS